MPVEAITTAEAARMLGVSRWTVVRYIREGRLPAFRLPSGRLRLYRHNVEDLIRQGREDIEQDRR